MAETESLRVKQPVRVSPRDVDTAGLALEKGVEIKNWYTVGLPGKKEVETKAGCLIHGQDDLVDVQCGWQFTRGRLGGKGIDVLHVNMARRRTTKICFRKEVDPGHLAIGASQNVSQVARTLAGADDQDRA